MSDKTVQLIEIVKKYPALYDPSHLNYKSKKIKNKIWDYIAKVQEKDGYVVKAKWKNLRDSYGKHLRSHQPQTGSASKIIDRYKTWPWVKHMSFLQPFLEYSATQSSSPVSSREFDIHPDQVSTTFQQPGTSYQKLGTALQHAAVQYQDASVQEQRSLSQHTQHNQRHPREPQFDDIITSYNNITEYDETDLIFLGYAKTIKKMSLRRQALVKFSIAKIIMKAEIEHVEETRSHNNIIRSRSPSDNHPINRNNSPQEFYNFPPNYDEEPEEFLEPIETKVELQDFDSISSESDPLSLASQQNYSQQNHNPQQKSISTSVADDSHITYSQVHSSFNDQFENKMTPSSEKKVKVQQDSEKKS